MTPAQREQLNRFLAEQVLGWEVKDWGYKGLAYKHTAGSIWDYEWTPISSWANCEPLLDKIERDGWRWYIGYHSDKQWMRVYKNSHTYTAYSDSRNESICLAIARAYGWKEEG